MAEQKAGGFSTKYRFTGKEQDALTGLNYFGARYYDARLSLWYGVDPMAEKKLDWNPYRYGFNNPIRLIDPTGMSEEEVEFPPKDFKGNSWCDSDGCFNRTNESSPYEWRDTDGKPVSYYSSEAEIKSSKTWHSKLASATENFFGVTEADLHDPESDAVYKMMEKEVSIVINFLSFGEGAVALQGASRIGKGIVLFGMANDVNDLADDITGFNLAEFTLGEKGADRLKAINAFTGIFSSYNFNKTFPEFNMAIGNVGDAKDLYELDTKICYDKSK